MKYGIYYESVTGNTEQLARAIEEALPPQECKAIAFTREAEEPLPEFLLIGFWTDKGACPPATQSLLTGLHGKKIALFGTAGFGSGTYFDGILGRVRSLIPADNQVLGGFLCPGGMPERVKEKYAAVLERHPEDARAKSMLEAFERAKGHPAMEDLAQAAAFAQAMYAKAGESGRGSFA